MPLFFRPPKRLSYWICGEVRDEDGQFGPILPISRQFSTFSAWRFSANKFSLDKPIRASHRLYGQQFASPSPQTVLTTT